VAKSVFRADLVVQVLDDAPGQAQAVERARAAADLVEDDQAARGGAVEDVRRLAHFHHERALPAREVVARADPRKNAVHEINAADFAGTNEPMCASSVSNATCRM